ncbi:anti-sigma factor family protein [Paraburkholderia rhizosphaerae]|uniref:Anti-sigma factor RsiW n=1 Tax=Paraburkholderia rhizosphaerae TaxID=480658 RepID=A0A4R8L5X9_9BURK|nr:anti-sigma factor [Paraburkholderia rhizosphaerae]TDY37449.1 anti-sigma factor RsiW [Paraburkholderia rhizosphaerae]
MKIDDVLLLSYVDGMLPSDQKQQVEEGIGSSAELAERVALLRASRLPYQNAFAHQKLPEVPERLVALVGRIARGEVHAQFDDDTDAPAGEIHLGANSAGPPPVTAGVPPAWQLPRGGAFRIAPAWLAVAFVAGAFCWGAVFRLAADARSGSGMFDNTPLASLAGGASPWVVAAAGYQQLYAHETLAEVQPDMVQSARIVDEIRHEDGLDVHVPDLTSSGLTFKRVQRLRFHGRPLVQIVYLPATGSGAPVALCVTKEAKPDHPIAEQSIDDMSVITWRRAQLGYALIGKRDGVALPDLGKMLAEDRSGQLFGKAFLDSVLASMT